MLVKVSSIALHGIETIGVTVEVNVSSRGLPYFDIVGLPAKSIDESKHRVKTAFQNLDIAFPDKRITVNLAPGDINKEGSFYDLPIALGILCALYDISVPKNSLFFGEVSLDGTLRHTKGSFLLSLYAKENDIKNIFVPVDCLNEAGSVEGIRVYGVNNLNDLYKHIVGEKLLRFRLRTGYKDVDLEDTYLVDNDFNNIIGQDQAKRALEICAAGGHNLLMIGPPGAGKTILAKSFVSILPPLETEESIQVTKIYSSVGQIPQNKGLIRVRPFRSPHHTISYAGMIGGGNVPSPGEITLAHRGVLFMDEFNEFTRAVLEALRQPLEDGEVTVSRSRGRATFPSKFILVASSNPCPCGYNGHPKKECFCPPKRIQNYQRKMSGPLLDRIDLQINVAPVEKDKLLNFRDTATVENSSEIRQRVVKARNIQVKRLKSFPIFTNSEMRNKHVKTFCLLDNNTELLLNQASEKFNLSTRVYFKLIKVARTIADLSDSNKIQLEHMAEAIRFKTP